MNLAQQTAKQFREVYLNGNWVSSNLKTQLEDVTWKEATAKIGSLNTIAALSFHINYYVAGVANVLEGGSLDIRDKYSFDLPAIASEDAWQSLKNNIFRDGERFASLLEQLPEEKFGDNFVDAKYGNYLRNIQSIIDHSYYHLGQIVIIKKLVRSRLIR